MTKSLKLPESVLLSILRQCDEPTRDKTMLASKGMKRLTDAARRSDYAAAAQRPGRLTKEKLPTYEELVARNCPDPNRDHIAKTLGVSAGDASKAGPLTGLYSRASGLATAKMVGCAHLEPPRGGQMAYAGGFRDGKYHGHGQQRSKNKFYEGGFSKGVWNGHGVFVWPGSKFYEGDFKDGQLHGHGVFVINDVSRYEGSFVSGRYEGYGVLTRDNGESYRGDFKNSKYEGEGVNIDTNGTRYEGSFKAGFADGYGTFAWTDGNGYRGGVKDARPHGQGVWTGADGTRHVGMFEAGQGHGRGIRTEADGARYDGNFRADQRDGQGVLTNPDGTSYAGAFRAGLYHGQGVFKHADGTPQEGIWQLGVLQPEPEPDIASDAAIEALPNDEAPLAVEPTRAASARAAIDLDAGSESGRESDTSLATDTPTSSPRTSVASSVSESPRRSFLAVAMNRLRQLGTKSQPGDNSARAQLMSLPARRFSDAELDDRLCPLSLDKLQDISNDAVFWKRGKVLVGASHEDFYLWWNAHHTDPETTAALPAKALFRRR